MDTAKTMLAYALEIQAGQPDEAARVFSEILKQDPANLAAHNALEHMQASQRVSRWMQVNCVIDPRDDIFRFFANHELSKNPIREYLSDGWRTLSQLMLLLESVDQSLLKQTSVLEFAAGFGRFTRHLAKILPGRVTCSDVMPGSVDFLKNQFGVQGFESCHEPEKIIFPATYELVFVLSMFTHLPVHMWGPWLQALKASAKPGGLLVFSVHNECSARESGVLFDANGTHFIASSESSLLDKKLYGTTFTTKQFVIDIVEQEFGRTPLFYQTRAFWHGQDAVVVQF